MVISVPRFALWISFAFVCVVFHARAQWSTMQLSEARIKPAAATIGEKGFFAGGWNGTAASSRVDIYDNTSGTWTTAELSVARRNVAGAGVGNKVLFAGGHDGTQPSAVVDIYDDATGTWTTAALSEARHSVVAATYHDYVFFAGGEGADYSDVVDIYNSVTDTWTTSNLSEPRIVNGAAVVGSTIFFPGGKTETGVSGVVDVYDVVLEEWSTKTLPFARERAAVAAYGDLLIVAGGFSGHYSERIDIYDVASDKWDTQELVSPRADVTPLNYSSRIYLAGGADAAGPFSDVDILEFSFQPYGVGGHIEWPTGYSSMGAAVTGSNLLFAGGESSTGPSDVVRVYDVDCAAVPITTDPPSPSGFCPGADIEVYFDGAQEYTLTPREPFFYGTREFIPGPYIARPRYGVTGITNGCHIVTELALNASTDTCPEIFSFSPTAASPGSIVTITGKNFVQEWGEVKVSFGGFKPPATIVDLQPGQIKVVVPEGWGADNIIVSYGDSWSPSSLFTWLCGTGMTYDPVVTTCVGESVVLEVSGAYTYDWTPSPDLEIGSSGALASPTTTTTYYVVGHDIDGCSTSAEILVKVEDCPMHIDNVLPYGGPIGSTITINGYKFSTTPGLNIVKLGSLPLTVTSATSREIKAVIPPGATTGVITVTVDGVVANGPIFTICSPPVLVVNQPNVICSPAVATLTASGADSYQWSPATGLNATHLSSVIASPATTTTYTVKGNIGPCSSTASVTVQVGTHGTNVSVTPSQNACYGESVTLQATGASNFIWTPVTGLDSTTGSTVVATPPATTTYTVSGANCEGQATTTITIGLCPLNVTLAEPASNLQARVFVEGATGMIDVTFHHRGIRSAEFTAETPVRTSLRDYTRAISNNWFDDIGIEYYFTVTDALGQSGTSEKKLVQLEHQSQIPGLATGTTQAHYRLFSIPRQLEYTLVDSVFRNVFTHFNGYDDTQWRLVRYQDGENMDYPGFTTIEPGKGYWFLSTASVPIIVKGKPILSTIDAPFTLELQAGWNQIGSPFGRDVSWSDLMEKNGNPTGVGFLYIFDPATTSFKSSNRLRAWSGGFVNAAQNVTLSFPPNVQTIARTQEDEEHNYYQLDQPDWFLPLTVEHDVIINSASGIGMHPSASASRDRFDESTLPRFGNYVEVSFPHPEYFQPTFMRDVVPTADHHHWEFSVRSNNDKGPAKISWNAEAIATQRAAIFLYDPTEAVLVDMKATSEYRFTLERKRNLVVFFGKDIQSIQAPVMLVGNAYPNPAKETVTFPVIVSPGRNVIETTVYNLHGKPVTRFETRLNQSGYYELTWNTRTSYDESVPGGVYVVRISDGAVTRTMKVIVKR